MVCNTCVLYGFRSIFPKASSMPRRLQVIQQADINSRLVKSRSCPIAAAKHEICCKHSHERKAGHANRSSADLATWILAKYSKFWDPFRNASHTKAVDELSKSRAPSACQSVLVSDCETRVSIVFFFLSFPTKIF